MAKMENGDMKMRSCQVGERRSSAAKPDLLPMQMMAQGLAGEPLRSLLSPDSSPSALK